MKDGAALPSAPKAAWLRKGRRQRAGAVGIETDVESRNPSEKPIESGFGASEGLSRGCRKCRKIQIIQTKTGGIIDEKE